MPAWAQWISLGLAAFAAVGVAFNIFHQAWQRRRDAAAEQDRLQIRPPHWIGGWGGWFRLEVVNVGQRPVFVRAVRLHAPSLPEPMDFEALDPTQASRPIGPGGSRLYERSGEDIHHVMEGLSGGVLITVETSRGQEFHLDVDPAALTPPS